MAHISPAAPPPKRIASKVCSINDPFTKLPNYQILRCEFKCGGLQAVTITFMLHLRLKDGAPDEPDTGDWDAICATPSPDTFFYQLFHEVSQVSLPAANVVSEETDDIRQIRVGWRGSPELGVEITVVTCTETSDLPVYCIWETHGLPGMEIKWHYALEYAGQLGHVAFRHIDLKCAFDGPTSQNRFAGIWQRVIGKEPSFEETDRELA